MAKRGCASCETIKKTAKVLQEHFRKPRKPSRNTPKQPRYMLRKVPTQFGNTSIKQKTAWRHITAKRYTKQDTPHGMTHKYYDIVYENTHDTKQSQQTAQLICKLTSKTRIYPESNMQTI